MRLWILIPMLLLPLTACMTQRDQTIWQEFKTEISKDKAEASKEAEAATTTEAAAADEAVVAPAPVDKE